MHAADATAKSDGHERAPGGETPGGQVPNPPGLGAYNSGLNEPNRRRCPTFGGSTPNFRGEVPNFQA